MMHSTQKNVERFRALGARVSIVGATIPVAAGSLVGLSLLTATPASAQEITNLNVVFSIPIFGTYGQQSEGMAGDAPATVASGANFTTTFTPAFVTPPILDVDTGVSFSADSVQGITYIIPIPAGAAYVSSSVSGDVTWTGGPSSLPSGSVPLTATYCTANGAGCTATATSSTFEGSTTTPYLELATPGEGASSAIAPDELPVNTCTDILVCSNAILTFPTVSVVLTATGAPGSTIQPSVSEYDATNNLCSPLVLTQEIEAWPAALLTVAQEAPGQPLPPPLMTPLSTTTITAPAPTITSISPREGAVPCGATVTITGTNLGGATAVDFGTNAATITADSATSITVISPPGDPGEVEVTVTTPGGTGNAGVYTYLAAPPVITLVSPRSGSTAGGTVVTISGSVFNCGTTAVDFGSIPATSFTVNSDQSITAVSPPEPAGTVGITVTSAVVGTISGIDIAAGTYTYVSPPAITALSPTSGPVAGGTSVTISGTGLSGATAVDFGTTAGTITADTATSITVTSPPGSSGAVSVTVTTPGGLSNAETYTFVAPSTGKAPVVKLVFPKSGSTAGGRLVLIEGSNFTGATSVVFGLEPALFLVLTPNWIVALSPSAPAGTCDITVTTPSGTSATSISGEYTYVGAPRRSRH